jgi:hypothetical protein
MNDYRGNGGRVHGLEPTIDWRALFVLFTFLSAAICIAMVAML